MKIHIGCGMTLLSGFVNIDNSPTALVSRMPAPVLSLLGRLRLMNPDQLGFARVLKQNKKEFLYSSCLRLPFKDNSIDFAYSSHMLGWCLGKDQLHQFLRELSRVLRPGGGTRLSFFDLDGVLSNYQQHRDTIRLMEEMPLGAEEFSLRDKFRLLLTANRQNGIPLNAETFGRLLTEHGFHNIRTLEAGATTMEPQWVEGLDLFERDGGSVYMECRKNV